MNDFKIEEIKSQEKLERVAVHSHIKGLGLDSSGKTVENNSCGLIGQKNAREAAGVIVEMIKSKKMAGKAVLLTGPPCSGKTALAIAVSREIGARVPFCPISGAEVFSSEIKKTEVLKEHFRRAIGIRVKEKKEVYEGEVTEIKPIEAGAPLTGYGRTIMHVMLGLKTSRGTRMLKLDPEVYEGLQRERVAVGDVIYIEGNSGSVKRIGRSDAFATEFDLEADEYVPLPKGDVHKQRNVVQDVTLHDLDMANAKPEGGSDVLSLMGKIMRPKKTEITEKLRREVDKVVARYVQQGVAEVVPGVLFIDEVHMLDIECFSFLNRALESPLAPIVVFATNRGVCKIRGTNNSSPFGVPVDFIDRTVVVRTEPLTGQGLAEILRLRAAAEGVSLDEKALMALLQAALAASLRYSLQLLTPARLLAEAAGLKEVGPKQVEEAREMFWDCRRSAQRLVKEEEKFLL